MRARLACLPLLVLLGACAARTVPAPAPAPGPSPAVVVGAKPSLITTVPLGTSGVAPDPVLEVAPAPTVVAIEPEIDTPQDRVQALSFDALTGWIDGDHTPILLALRTACDKLLEAPIDSSVGGHAVGGVPLFGTGADWSAPCSAAAKASDATGYFEKYFAPVALGGSEDSAALFTAYYEPELNGSRTRGGPYQHPLYALPADVKSGVPYFDRAAIDAGALEGRGLELFWLADPVESFFLHIQGSGRIRLPDGTVARVGYAGKNNHPYKAVGRTLVEWNELPLEGMSKRKIEDWVAANPARRDELLGTNPSYVFFTEREELSADPSLGPIGAFGQPLPNQRAVAIDRRYYALGIPMWVDFVSPVGPVQRLVMALDTGGAIKGSRRADFFFGSGEAAGKAAGSTRVRGQLIALTPRAAYERVFGPIS